MPIGLSLYISALSVDFSGFGCVGLGGFVRVDFVGFETVGLGGFGSVDIGGLGCITFGGFHMFFFYICHIRSRFMFLLWKGGF